MIRLFVTDSLGSGAEFVLGRDQAHYLATVMRQGIGAEVLLFNGRDGEWQARLTAVDRRQVRLRAERQTRPQASPPDVELIVAVIKRHRLETLAEKAAELGARRVRLVFTERTNAERVRLDRLIAIATEAAEQTERLDVPAIEAPVKLAALLEDWGDRRLLYCDEGGQAPPILDALGGPGLAGASWSILIGPEGGFSPAERTRLRTLPAVLAVGLGPRVLRADTAAMAALALWQARLGDWGKV